MRLVRILPKKQLKVTVEKTTIESEIPLTKKNRQALKDLQRKIDKQLSTLNGTTIEVED